MHFLFARPRKIVCASMLCLVFASVLTASAQDGGSTQVSLAERQSLNEIRKQGFAYLQTGSWEAACSAFEKVLAIDPNDAQSLYGSAVALFNLKQVPEAELKLDTVFKVLDSAKGNDRLVADSLVLSAVISAVRNNNSLAIEKLEKAVKLVPSHFDANFSLGRAYFGEGDLERSVAAFRRAVSIEPNHLRARFFLATTLEREGNSADALKEYRAILKVDPKSAEGNLGLGVLLLKTEGDASAEGLHALEMAVELDDGLYEGHVTLGRILVRLNRPTEAIAHLKKAVELAPDNPEPHFQLSIAYRKMKMRQEADAESEIVKRIHESHRGVPSQNPQ